MTKMRFAAIYERFESKLDEVGNAIRRSCEDDQEFVAVIELVIGYFENLIDG